MILPLCGLKGGNKLYRMTKTIVRDISADTEAITVGHVQSPISRSEMATAVNWRLHGTQSFRRFGGAGLVHLKRLTNLKRFEMRDSPITGADMACLKELTHLNTVDIAHSRITQAERFRVAS